MILYRTTHGVMVDEGGRWFRVPVHGEAAGGDVRPAWDELVNRDDLSALLREVTEGGRPEPGPVAPRDLLAPIGSQEVWAAGVTYYRSRTARMEESEAAGGGDFYARVYQADRPELFIKATPHRVVGPGGAMRLRADSKWIVPEPELTLCVTRSGKIIGYTVGNDLSCRDIEGENPLYLPQAKTFDGCAAVGPGILIADEPPAADAEIRLEIVRNGTTVLDESTTLSQMKRTPEELVGYLFRESSFPSGCLLMTGTGIVPPDDFSLRGGDEVRITIDTIGTLVNTVE